MSPDEQTLTLHIQKSPINAPRYMIISSVGHGSPVIYLPQVGANLEFIVEAEHSVACRPA